MNIKFKENDKAKVLSCLYNASKQQGMGYLDPRGQNMMSEEEAQKLLSNQTYFDYVYGRVMKIDLSSNIFDPRLYDRDNGENAASLALTGYNIMYEIIE
jgi:hypothetical protein